MGGCFSDIKGGKQAAGGDQQAAAASGAAAMYQQSSSAAAAGAAAASASSEAVDVFLRHQGVGGLSSQVELSLSASKLRNLDYLSKSDPMAVIYMKKKDGRLEEIGRTEVILNTLDPIWVTKIITTYQFEVVQPLVFRVYDVDTKYHNIPVKLLNLADQDFIGEATCALSEIVTKTSRTVTINLQSSQQSSSGNRYGTLTVHVEEAEVSRTAVEVVFRCSDLVNKDLFSKSDPFLRVSKVVETGVSIPVCKTEVIDDNLNPVWKPVYLSLQHIGSKVSPLIIECYDFDSSGNHELIGKIQKTMEDLEKLFKERTGLHFYSPSGRHQDKMLKSQLYVDKYIEKPQYTFIDYVSSGFELNFMVAVDFTASNGNPRQPSSLHFIDPTGRLNSYHQAIVEVGEVIQFYDSDKRFPAWGFGGRPIGGSVSHCFNLNGSNSECEVVGIEGILAAYATALQNVSLAGPTLFGQVINNAAQSAAESVRYNQRKYFVLLIITDGVITDIEETKDAIVRASDLPLSILIVGVGGADFTAMEILDADKGKRLESSTGRVATRDIVQFVPMREVYGGQISIVQSLLEELPGQFLTYMRSRNIKPDSAESPEAYS